MYKKLRKFGTQLISVAEFRKGLLLSLFIINLSDALSNCKSFGYAEYFKTIESNQSQLANVAKSIQNWSMTAAINELTIELTIMQSDLEFMLTPNSSLSDNSTTK